jgi:excisionase family DNA binding protein
MGHIDENHEETTMPGDAPPEEWITTQQAAALTGYSPSRFRQLAKRGVILARKFGRDWSLNKAAVLAYHQKMQQLGTSKHNPWR